MAASTTMPCPYLVGAALCAKPDGHGGRHKPAPPPGVLPEITASRLNRILREPAWWRRKPRCPDCRQVIALYWRGQPGTPRPGRGGWLVNEYAVSFVPCGHQFRRIYPVAGEKR